MKKTDEEIINAVNNNLTMLSAANSIGMSMTTFRARAIKLNVYKPNQSRKGVKRLRSEYEKITIPLNEILEGLHPTYATGHLKRRLLKEGIKEEVCENLKCNVTSMWLNEYLSLHLDHIDGDCNNHKLENLRLLCPNCHTQTPTYAGKNKNKNRKNRK